MLKDNGRLFTLVTNTLAKDKEISDRWRGFKDVADSRHLGNRVEREVVDALVAAVRAAYPANRPPLLPMKARWLGLTKLAHWDRNAPLPEKPERTIPWVDAEAYRAASLWRLRARDVGDRGSLLQAQLDRCTGARRQSARRLLAPNGAVRRTPMC